MQRRNLIITAVITILIMLIVVASFAPIRDAPYIVSPLALQSPQMTPTVFGYMPLILCADCPTPRPTLPGDPTQMPTSTPRPTP